MILSKIQKEEIQVLYHKYIYLNSSFKKCMKARLNDDEDYEQMIITYLKQGIPMRTPIIYHQISHETGISFEDIKLYIDRYKELLRQNKVIDRVDMLMRGSHILCQEFKIWLKQPKNNKFILPAYTYAKDKEDIQNVILSFYNIDDCKKIIKNNVIVSPSTLNTLMMRNDVNIFEYYYPFFKDCKKINLAEVHKYYSVINIEPSILEKVVNNNTFLTVSKQINKSYFLNLHTDKDILNTLTSNQAYNICTLLKIEHTKKSTQLVKKILFSKYLSILKNEYHEDKEVGKKVIFTYLDKNIINQKSYDYFYEKISSLDNETKEHFHSLFKMKNLSINLVEKKSLHKNNKI